MGGHRERLVLLGCRGVCLVYRQPLAVVPVALGTRALWAAPTPPLSCVRQESSAPVALQCVWIVLQGCMVPPQGLPCQPAPARVQQALLVLHPD